LYCSEVIEDAGDHLVDAGNECGSEQLLEKRTVAGSSASTGDHAGRRGVEVDVVAAAAHAIGRASPRPEGSRRARRRAALTRSRSVTTTPKRAATWARRRRSTASSASRQASVFVVRPRPFVTCPRASAIPGLLMPLPSSI